MAVLGLGCCRKSLCLYSSIGGPAKLREGSILSSEDGTNADCYRKVLSAFFFFFLLKMQFLFHLCILIYSSA